MTSEPERPGSIPDSVMFCFAGRCLVFEWMCLCDFVWSCIALGFMGRVVIGMRDIWRSRLRGCEF